MHIHVLYLAGFHLRGGGGGGGYRGLKALNLGGTGDAKCSTWGVQEMQSAQFGDTGDQMKLNEKLVGGGGIPEECHWVMLKIWGMNNKAEFLF